jgi:hypothetical protein
MTPDSVTDKVLSPVLLPPRNKDVIRQRTYRSRVCRYTLCKAKQEPSLLAWLALGRWDRDFFLLSFHYALQNQKGSLFGLHVYFRAQGLCHPV